MKRWLGGLLLILVFVACRAQAQERFTLEQALSAPFPANLVASKTDNRIAWTLDEQGKRNVWVAEGPEFKARRLTSYLEDDGQELSSLSFSTDGETLVYVRGGGKNPAGQYPNPTSNPAGVEQAVWAVKWSGGEPKKIDAGHSAKTSPGGWVAYTRDGQIWIAPLDGSAKPMQIVARGQNGQVEWSPNGKKLAFTSARNDHSFIGVYDVETKTVKFLAPSVDSDQSPQWSADGKCEAEQWSFTPDKKMIVFNSNCGDIDRRHLWSVGVDGSELRQWEKSDTIKWGPIVLADGKAVAHIGSGPTAPARVLVTKWSEQASANKEAAGLSASYPADKLVNPQQAIFKSGDGWEIHGQLFVPKNLKAGEKRPALIFIHGGSMRQMLLGWHYMYYYSNAYAMNQYLANHGYVVLALNYRSGIGYGRAFREAPGRAGRGAKEYEDVAAAGKYLQTPR